MALSKKDIETIREIAKELMAGGKQQATDQFKRTEKRLWAYPRLRENIKRYKADIEDVKREDMKKSKDFVVFVRNSGGAEAPDLEALRAAKILTISQKIARDEHEIKEMDAALAAIKDDEYYNIIDTTYFQNLDQSNVARVCCIDRSNIWRQKKRLINIMNAVLYGADAL